MWHLPDFYAFSLYCMQESYKDTVEFYFPSRNWSKTFWKKCIEHHSFFRCHSVRRGRRTKPRVISHGSSFRSVWLLISVHNFYDFHLTPMPSYAYDKLINFSINIRIKIFPCSIFKLSQHSMSYRYSMSR